MPTRKPAPEPIGNPAELGFSPDRLRRIGLVFQGFIDRGQIPGAVILLARDRRLAYLEAFGFQDRENKVPMATDAIFRIASMTKPITSVAILMLAEEGLIDLQAPAAQYLPEFQDVKVAIDQRLSPFSQRPEFTLAPPRRPMTVHDLLRHTSGLVYPEFGSSLLHQAYGKAELMDRDQPLARMATKLARLPLAHHPGTVWEYGLSTDVLGRIVEVVSGMALDRFFATRILKPLGMASTGFVVREADRARLAEPQIDRASGKRPPMLDVTRKPRWLSGGMGLAATAADYLRFCHMMMNGGELDGVRLLSPKTVELMTADALPPGIGYTDFAMVMLDLAPTPAMGQGFGLGFAMRTEAGRHPLPGSVGTYYWAGVWGTAFWIDPRERLVAVLMTQVPFATGGPYRRVLRYLAYQAVVDRLR